MVWLVDNEFASRLETAHDSVVTTIYNAMTTQVMAYATAPPTQRVRLSQEVNETWRRTRQRFADDDSFHADDYDFFSATGAQRALDDFPLTDLEAGVDVAYLAGLRHVLATAKPGDREELMRFANWSTEQIGKVKETILASYVRAEWRTGDRNHAREALLRLLLDGTAGTAAARAAGVALSNSYLLLLCQPQHPRDADAMANPHEIARLLGRVPGALWQTNRWTGTLLVVLPADEPETSAVRALAAELTGAVADIVGQRINAVEVRAAHLDDVPAAYRQVREAMGWVAAMPDAQSRPYRPDELLIEKAISTDPELRQNLGAVLEPLRHGTDLLPTLEALFECELNREDAAKALYIHRRTLTYRLNRIRELTGIEPTSPHGVQVLRSALTASRLTIPGPVD